MRVVRAIQGCLRGEKDEVITGILVMTRVSTSQPVPENTCMYARAMRQQHPSRPVRKDQPRPNSRSEQRVPSQPGCPRYSAQRSRPPAHTYRDGYVGGVCGLGLWQMWRLFRGSSDIS